MLIFLFKTTNKTCHVVQVFVYQKTEKKLNVQKVMIDSLKAFVIYFEVTVSAQFEIKQSIALSVIWSK